MEDSDLQVADGDPAGDADLIGDEDLVKDVKQAVNVSARVHVGHFDLAFVVCESTTWLYSLAFFFLTQIPDLETTVSAVLTTAHFTICISTWCNIDSVIYTLC